MRAYVILALASLLTLSAAGGQSNLSGGEHTAVLNGVKLWYKVAGKPQAGIAPLLYLPGGPGYNSYSFEKTIGVQLEPHVQVIYFDERGTGRSERPTSGDYAMSTLVADIDTLRLSLGLEKLSVMGHSFGGTLALEYARRYPEHVQKLILVDGAADYPSALHLWETELQQRESARWSEAIKTESGKALMQAEQHPENACALTKARFAVIWLVYSEPGMAQFHHWQQFHDQRFKLEQGALDHQGGFSNTGEIQNAYLSNGNDALCYRFTQYERLKMPVLVIEGKFDGSVDPKQAQSLAGNLPNAQYDVFESSGHFPYAEEPVKFVQDVTRFLRTSTPD